LCLLLKIYDLAVECGGVNEQITQTAAVGQVHCVFTTCLIYSEHYTNETVMSVNELLLSELFNVNAHEVDKNSHCS